MADGPRNNAMEVRTAPTDSAGLRIRPREVGGPTAHMRGAQMTQTTGARTAQERERFVSELHAQVGDAKQELRDLVQAAARAVGNRRHELRNRPSYTRRRVVRMCALRQGLTGTRGRLCRVEGKWPADMFFPVDIPGVLLITCLRSLLPRSSGIARKRRGLRTRGASSVRPGKRYPSMG